jgi:hypothetical protein
MKILILPKYDRVLAPDIDYITICLILKKTTLNGIVNLCQDIDSLYNKRRGMMFLLQSSIYS